MTIYAYCQEHKIKEKLDLKYIESVMFNYYEGWMCPMWDDQIYACDDYKLIIET